jgi:hypothetical protein
VLLCTALLPRGDGLGVGCGVVVDPSERVVYLGVTGLENIYTIELQSCFSAGKVSTSVCAPKSRIETPRALSHHEIDEV